MLWNHFTLLLFAFSQGLQCKWKKRRKIYCIRRMRIWNPTVWWFHGVKIPGLGKAQAIGNYSTEGISFKFPFCSRVLHQQFWGTCWEMPFCPWCHFSNHPCLWYACQWRRTWVKKKGKRFHFPCPNTNSKWIGTTSSTEEPISSSFYILRLYYPWT